MFNNWFNIAQFEGLHWHLDYKWNLFDHVGDLSSFDFRNKQEFKPRQGLARCYTPSRDFPKHQGVRQHDEVATCDSKAYQAHDSVVNTLAGLAQGTGRLASDRPGFQASATPVQYIEAPRVNIKKPWKCVCRLCPLSYHGSLPSMLHSFCVSVLTPSLSHGHTSSKVCYG